MVCKELLLINQWINLGYSIEDNSNYYFCLSEWSCINIKSNSVKLVNINYNIWGPGNITISCNTDMNASISTYHGDEVIKNLPVYKITPNTTQIL